MLKRFQIAVGKFTDLLLKERRIKIMTNKIIRFIGVVPMVVFLFLSVSVFCTTYNLAQEKNMPQKDEVTFKLHPLDHSDYYVSSKNADWFYRYAQRNRKLNWGSENNAKFRSASVYPWFIRDNNSAKIQPNTVKLADNIDISYSRLEDKSKFAIMYDAWDGGDGGVGSLYDGIPVTSEEFYKTFNYKTKRLNYAQIRTDAISHSFANWNLEGSELELIGDLTDAIVTNCFLVAPRLSDSCLRLESYIPEKFDEQLAPQAFKTFAQTWNYKNDALDGITLYGVDLRHANFAGMNVSKMSFLDCKFHDETNKNESLFRGATITAATRIDFGHSTDFKPRGNWPVGMSAEQLYQTENYKYKTLVGLTIPKLPTLDLRDQNLSDSYLFGVIDINIDINRNVKGDLSNYQFTGAYLRNTTLHGISKDQLYSTHSYKNEELIKIYFIGCDLSNAAFVRMTLVECIFRNTDLSKTDFKQTTLVKCAFYDTDLNKADFTDSVISGCDFKSAQNLTINQIKSTWNYKNNRMSGISLPEEIQKQLDAEKQAVKN
jgi:uncharacterized protein YjbI with pentapeptide repeats